MTAHLDREFSCLLKMRCRLPYEQQPTYGGESGLCQYMLALAGAFILAMIFHGCRGDVVPTDNDMASYGWVLYEDGDYVAVSYTHLTLPTNREV